MIRPKAHEQIIQLLISTNQIFQSFTADDHKSTTGREAPPETNADKLVAEYLTSKLAMIVPGHAIIVEDGDPVAGRQGLSTWVIDPIDGTIPFMYHIPSYLISVYEMKDNVILSAFAYNPSNGDVFYSNGKRSFCNNKPLRVSTHSSLVEARIALSGYALEMLPDLYAALREAGAYIIVQEGLVFRSTLVASGYIDATIQVGLKQFESGAVQSLVTNAGGKVNSCSKDNIKFLETTPNVVISNSNLNPALLSVLGKVVDGNS